MVFVVLSLFVSYYQKKKRSQPVLVQHCSRTAKSEASDSEAAAQKRYWYPERGTGLRTISMMMDVRVSEASH